MRLKDSKIMKLYYSAVNKQNIADENNSTTATNINLINGLRISANLDYNNVNIHIAQLIGQRNILAIDTERELDDAKRELLYEQIDYINDHLRDILAL